MTKYDLEKIKDLKKERKFKARTCFCNASSAKIGLNEGSYVEGFLIDENNNFCEHGWIENDNGKVIEVTLKDLKESYQYIPVNKYPGITSAEIIIEKTKGRTPIFMFDEKARQKITEIRLELIKSGFIYPSKLENVYYNK